MSCCKENFGDNLYLPLNQRLLKYGADNTAPEMMLKYPETAVWIFSFFDKESMECEDCMSKFKSMVMWFEKFGLLKNPINNVKWILTDDMKISLIYRDIGLSTNSPTHLICDKSGNILDIIKGFPDDRFLEKYILPLVAPKF